VELWIKLETALSFSAVTSPMFEFLCKQDYQTSVNNEIATQLQKLAPPTRTALYKQYRCADTDPDRSTPKIRIILANNLSHPSDKSSTLATTRALVVECPFEDRNLIEYYMAKLSRHTSGYSESSLMCL
jgi:hypothetical protein